MCIVCQNAYGVSAAWEGLQPALDRTALLRTSTGRLVLCLEADATHDEGFRQIEAVTRRQISKGSWRSHWTLGSARGTALRESKFRTLRVYLGNTSAVVPVGNGDSLTVRERAIMRSEMDVAIDSRAPLLERVLSWVESVSPSPHVVPSTDDSDKSDDGLSPHPGSRPAILFDTNDESYFASVASVLRPLGYDVMNDADVFAALLARKEQEQVVASQTKKHAAASAELGHLRPTQGATQQIPSANTQKASPDNTAPDRTAESDSSEEIKPELLPRLIYHRTTDETVSATLAAIENSRWIASVRPLTCPNFDSRLV